MRRLSPEIARVTGGLLSRDGETAGVSSDRRADEEAADDGVAGDGAGGDRLRGGRLPVAVAIVRLAWRADATFIAGSLAYSSIVAALPVVVLGFAVATELGGDAIATEAVIAAGDLLTPRGRVFVYRTLADVTRRGGIVVVAAALACFSVVQLFLGLDRAFSTVYAGGERHPFGGARDALFAFGVGGLGVSAVVVAAGALSLYANESLVRVAVPVTMFVFAAVALFPLFYSIPAAEVSRTEVLPGTLVAAGGWTVAGAVLGAFAAGSGGVGIYGVLGGLIVVVTWFYAANLLLIVGAATNAVLAERD